MQDRTKNLADEFPSILVRQTERFDCYTNNAIKPLQLNTSMNGWSNQHTSKFFCLCVVCVFVGEFELTGVDTCTETSYAHVLE